MYCGFVLPPDPLLTKSHRSAILISVAGLGYRYPGATVSALESIQLDIPEGSCFGLLGPNGAGKTTLISLLTGVLSIQQGDIKVAGHPLGNSAIRNSSALVPQDYAFYPSLTGRENLQFFMGLYRVPVAERSSRLEYCVDICALNEVLDQRASHYSGGIKRRLNIAIGLVCNPRILYLDEPTVGIDAQSRHYILQSIQQLKNSGMTIVYTSHYMEEVEQVCDEVAIIDYGRVLFQQSMDELLGGSGQLYITPVESPTSNQLDKLGCEWNGRHLIIEPGNREMSVVFAEMEASGIQISQIYMGRNRLEQIYLSVTSPELRE